jgi:phage major head subunit gpT-like protein
LAVAVITGPELVAGLRTTFRSTYDQYYKGILDKLSPIIEDVPSDKRVEIYAYQTAAAVVRRWPRNEDVRFEGFDSVGFSIENLNWGVGVDWHEDDRADDLLKNLYDRARQTGETLAQLPERIAFQFLGGSADPDLYPKVPNCPDGAALSSTTDGGSANRFGATNGNQLTATGTDTTSIRIDYFKVYAQFKAFLNTKNQPLHDLGVIDGGMAIYYPSTMERVFLEAFVQKRTLQIVQNAAATDNVGGAAVTQLVQDAQHSVDLVGTIRLSGTSWWAALKRSPVKPIIRQKRQAPSEAFATVENSDVARLSGKEYVRWKAREGYGTNLPFGLIKVV